MYYLITFKSIWLYIWFFIYWKDQTCDGTQDILYCKLREKYVYNSRTLFEEYRGKVLFQIQQWDSPSTVSYIINHQSIPVSYPFFLYFSLFISVSVLFLVVHSNNKHFEKLIIIFFQKILQRMSLPQIFQMLIFLQCI